MYQSTFLLFLIGKAKKQAEKDTEGGFGLCPNERQKEEIDYDPKTVRIIRILAPLHPASFKLTGEDSCP
jgi:hypothetical protein